MCDIWAGLPTLPLQCPVVAVRTNLSHSDIKRADIAVHATRRDAHVEDPEQASYYRPKSYLVDLFPSKKEAWFGET